MGKLAFRYIRGRLVPILAKKDRSLLLHVPKGVGGAKSAMLKGRHDLVKTLRKTKARPKVFSLERSILTKQIRDLFKKIPHRIKGTTPKGRKPTKALRRAMTKNKQMKALDKKIEKEFGFTHNPEDAGFIDRRGRMIDLSGRNQGNDFGGRVRDHREIQNVFTSNKVKPDMMGERSLNLFAYMDEAKSIRISDHGSVFNVDFSKPPTVGQQSVLRGITKGKRIFADLTNVKGETVSSGEFDTIQEALNALFGPKGK